MCERAAAAQQQRRERKSFDLAKVTSAPILRGVYRERETCKERRNASASGKGGMNGVVGEFE
jgi:hypothetical protein